MPYTLAMFFLWGLLMALIGIVIGWLLCRLRMRRRGSARLATRTHGERADDRSDRTDDVVRGPTE